MPIIVYVAWGAPQYTIKPPPWNALYAGIGEAWTDEIPLPAAMQARAVMWLLVAVTIVALTARRRFVAWAAAMLALTSLVVGLFNIPDRSPVAGASTVVCAGSRPVVCTRSVWEAGLSEATAVVEAGYAILPDSLVPGVVGSDPGAGVTGSGPDVIVEVSGNNHSPTNVVDRSSTLAALGDTIFISCAQAGSAQLTLLVWWRQTLALPLNRPVRPGDFVPATQLALAEYQRYLAAADRITRLSRSDRDRWFGAHAAQIRECTLTSADLP